MRTRSGQKYATEEPLKAEPTPRRAVVTAKATPKTTKREAKAKKAVFCETKVEDTTKEEDKGLKRRGRSDGAKSVQKSVTTAKTRSRVQRTKTSDLLITKDKEVEKKEEEVVAMETEEVEEKEKEDTKKRKNKKKKIELETTSEPTKKVRVSLLSVPVIPRVSGRLYSFGEEIAGELGLRLTRIKDTKVKTNEPSIVTDRDGQPLDDVVAVACGAMHSCCVTSEGKVMTFGCNDDAALGRDTQGVRSDETDDSIDADNVEERESRTPRLVAGLPPVVKVSAGDMHTCALGVDGSVHVWGNLKDDSTKWGLFVDDVVVVVETDGTKETKDVAPTALPRRIPLKERVVDIASGCHHILLLTEEGHVLSFGQGAQGQLGRIAEEDLQSMADKRSLFLEPQRVDFGSGSGPEVLIDGIWANHWSSYARSTAGEIYVFGLNNYHQLGFKSEDFIRLTNDGNESQTHLKSIVELKPTIARSMPSDVVSVANGQQHMLALDASGHVHTCGSNIYGKLGYKTDDSADNTVDNPRAITRDAFDGEDVVFVTCGGFTASAITQSGHLFCWGQGSASIGSEDFKDIESPTRVRGVVAESTRFVGVSSGSQHTLVFGIECKVNGN